jgi:hypothetical protein
MKKTKILKHGGTEAAEEQEISIPRRSSAEDFRPRFCDIKNDTANT